MNGRRKIQVFISSTYLDLKEERQTAVAAILKAGHIPAGMELFTAGDKSQLDVIKRWIDQSDAYMLILGTRYGSVEPDSGLGYTEIEYDYAISKGKPLFALVMSDEAIDKKLKSSGSEFLEKTNPEKLSAFRKRVLEKMSSFFDSALDIRASVYESLIDLSDNPELEGWVRASAAQDSKRLSDKLAEMTHLNEKLEKEVSELRVNAAPDSKVLEEDPGFSSLSAVLKAKSFTIPAEVAKEGAEVETNAYNLFVINKNIYVKGTTISQPTSVRTSWYEQNFYAVLVTHKLLDMDRRPDGVRFYSMSDLGMSYSAWLDMNSLNKE
ncbi:MAG: DUF4062 domain-containing protein [Brevundimonas sp.]|nr:DUF4062 domain-containing protein [Brevundimonas sp.]